MLFECYKPFLFNFVLKVLYRMAEEHWFPCSCFGNHYSNSRRNSASCASCCCHYESFFPIQKHTEMSELDARYLEKSYLIVKHIFAIYLVILLDRAGHLSGCR